MSISFTTISLADLSGAAGAGGGGALLPLGMMFGAADFDFAVEPASSAWFGLAPVPQLPSPISTSDFPDRRRPRKRSRPVPDADCAICLESARRGAPTLSLPCAHTFHRTCLFAVLTAPVLGACSMLRCPMCRSSVDRYDLRAMDLDVSPDRLALAQRRCHGLRRIATGHPAAPPTAVTVARLVRRCAATDAVDGFLYNTAVLALERSLFHRLQLARSLEMQLHAPRNRRFDVVEFIRTTVACHVEVLIRTATAAPP